MRAERTLKLIVEYDGTAFNGFQLQCQGERTVQGVLTDGLTRILQLPVSLAAAGRTDTGVHALGQVVSFSTTSAIPIERLAIALNSVLPSDVAAAKAEEVDSGFHARFSAKSRTYMYSVWCRRSRSAFWGRYALHFRRSLDIGNMQAASAELVGTRDFASFAKSGGNPGSTTVRDLQELRVRRVGTDLVVFKVKANGFLRSMVRNLVGCLLEVGAGELSTSDVTTIAANADRNANPCVPAAARGLCLLRVEY